jgi:hypothetical protein
MNQVTNWFAGLLLAMAPLAFGQDPQLAPQFPENALTSQQLVAWSRLQKPQPAPQPLPPRDTPLPQPDPQDPQAKPHANSDEGPGKATQSFTGKIIEDSGKYVLKVSSNTSYQLDQQVDVKQYVNQDVKIIGTLDTNTNTIRVVKVKLLS